LGSAVTTRSDKDHPLRLACSDLPLGRIGTIESGLVVTPDREAVCYPTIIV